MYNVYFTLRSVTWAQKARDTLQRDGIQSRLLRAPREIAPGGCAYVLTLPERDAETARQILDRAGVRWVGSFLRRADGSFVRLEP